MAGRPFAPDLINHFLLSEIHHFRWVHWHTLARVDSVRVEHGVCSTMSAVSTTAKAALKLEHRL